MELQVVGRCTLVTAFNALDSWTLTWWWYFRGGKMPPVLEEQLAKHLGLAELRVGAESGPGAQQVLAWWWVNVLPSFDRSWVVGAVHEEEWKSGPTAARVPVRGFVADADGAAVAERDTDEVLAALGALNPFRAEPTKRVRAQWGEHEAWFEMRTVDGLGYRLQWGTRATEGAFSFSNPEADWLIAFERVLYRFAGSVVSAAGVPRFKKQLRRWVGYWDELREGRRSPSTGQKRRTRRPPC
jgi:hypothetical protein